MNVIGADGNHVLPLMVPASGHQGLEIVNEGAGPEIHVDAAAQFFHHFLRRGTLVVAARAAQTVGRQLFPGDVGGVTLEVHAPLDALVNDAVHPVAGLIDADKVHDLGDAHHIVHIQNLAHLFSTEGSAGAFQLRHGGHTGGSQHILPQGGFLGVVQHEADALHAHHVANLVRIGTDGGGAPGEDGPAQVFGDHHGAFQMHVSVDIAGDQVAALAIVYGLGRQFRMFADLADPYHKAVQHVYLSGIDLASKHVEVLYVFYSQVAGNLSHSGLDQAAPVFIFQLSQCLPLHISKNRSADVVITSAVTLIIIYTNSQELIYEIN